MSQEIDDLLEIDSSLEINPESASTIIHILIRFFSPFFLLGIGCLYVDKFNGGYGELIIFGGLIILLLLFFFFEMIYYSVNNKRSLAFANLKVFGLLFILVVIVCITNVISALN